MLLVEMRLTPRLDLLSDGSALGVEAVPFGEGIVIPVTLVGTVFLVETVFGSINRQARHG